MSIQMERWHPADKQALLEDSEKIILTHRLVVVQSRLVLYLVGLSKARVATYSLYV